MMISNLPQALRLNNTTQRQNDPSFKAFFVKSERLVKGEFPADSYFFIEGKKGQFFDPLNFDAVKEAVNKVAVEDVMTAAKNIKQELEVGSERFENALAIRMFQYKDAFDKGLSTSLEKTENGFNVRNSIIRKVENQVGDYDQFGNSDVIGNKTENTINLPAFNQQVTQKIVYVPDEEVGEVTKLEHIGSKFHEYWNKL